MKINYPIKYAAMPIIDQVGWSHGLHELEREYDIVCYIVSKCYLISDLTKYTEDGRSIKEYEVVFPYQPTDFCKWQRVTPTYNLIHGYCTNSNKVDAVFNSYEEALNHVTEKNEKLCEDTWKCLPFSENLMKEIQEKRDEFDARLAEYKVLEQQILSHTDDIKVGENRKLNNVVRFVNNSGKILLCNIYEMLKLFDNDKFVVYNISQEQYASLTKLIDEEKIDDIKPVIGSTQGLLIHKTKDDVIKLAIEEGCGAYYIENNRISYDYKLDKVTQGDFENIGEDVLTFYTTETIEDLLNSYKKHSEIELRQIQNPVLKKVKKQN